jgi:hypothetical protein
VKPLYKAIISVGLLGLLSACAYDPASGRYYGASNNYYGQGNSYPNSAYSSNGYSGYQQPGYGYSNNQQRPYCPDDDDD